MLHFHSVFVVKWCDKSPRLISFIFLMQQPISSSFSPVFTYPILSPSSSSCCRCHRRRTRIWTKTTSRRLYLTLITKSRRETLFLTSYDMLSTSSRQPWYQSRTSNLPPASIRPCIIIICKKKILPDCAILLSTLATKIRYRQEADSETELNLSKALRGRRSGMPMPWPVYVHTRMRFRWALAGVQETQELGFCSPPREARPLQKKQEPELHQKIYMMNMSNPFIERVNLLYILRRTNNWKYQVRE